MEQHKHKNQNRLVIYRRRIGFSQKQVARLLGLKGTSMLSRYEHGRSLPPLQTAFCLGIVLRVPVEFSFQDSTIACGTASGATRSDSRGPSNRRCFPAHH